MNERKTKPQKQPLPSTPKEKPEKPTPKPRVVGVEAPAMDGYFVMERNLEHK